MSAESNLRHAAPPADSAVDPRGGGQTFEPTSHAPFSDPPPTSSYPPSNGRYVQHAGAAKLFVGQIPPSCNEDDLHQLFAPFGPLHEVVIFRSKANPDKAGYGFVTYTSRNDADAAIAALHFKAPMPKGSTLLQVKYADGETQVAEPKLFVGNLTHEVMESDLTRIFSPYGEVTEVVLLKQPDGTPKGSGFVRYKTLEMAHAAIDGVHNREDLHGRTLSVSMAEGPRDKQQRRRERPPFGGGREHRSGPYDRQYGDRGHRDRDYDYDRDMRGGYRGERDYGGHGGHGGMYGGPQPPQSYGAPPHQSNSGGYTPYAAPSHQAPYSASNFESVIQGIESQLANRNMHDPYQHQQPPPQYNAPPPSYHQAPPPSHAPPHSYNGYMPSPPPQAHQQQGGGHGGNDLLSMMMPRPGAPQSGGYHTDNNMRAALGSKQVGPHDSNLFVLHFPKEWRNEDLYTAFAPFGRIVSANIFMDKETGESKCFGFVSFDNPHSAHSAAGQLNGQQFGAKRIKVELKRQ